MVRREAAARLLDAFGRRFPKLSAIFNPAAESLYRQVTAQSQRPEAALAFAGFLARQQRLSEALDLCEAAGRTCPAERVAATLYSLLHLAQADEAQQGRIERWLATALTKSPESVALLVCLADLRDQQGRAPEAEELYRQALAREPNNILVLNNLGYLLAIRGVQAGQALEYIERAMHIGGMAPELLDTRAMVYLAQARYDLAIKDLEAAVALAPRGTLYYHLARAYWLAKNVPAATDAWQKAKAARVDVLRLSKEERTAYQQLAYELDKK
jgi:tetratricopeptide (TPR) repeat protein